ncbi:MAG TPA: tRNA lysidine(34) synthetase TilS, partial [Verrucomicrobiae bacterium]|nr:tRNA lysidine(34) synthetase TilS [Verrucomicrobiae bacterium]
VALQRRILQGRLMAAGVVPDYELIETLRHRPDEFVSTGPTMTVARDGHGIIATRSHFVPDFSAEEQWVDLRGRGGEARFDGTGIRWRVTAAKAGGESAAPGRRPGREIFDADRVGDRVVLRHWRAGDRFQPIGMKRPVKLQDLFTNAKIPRARRHRLVLAATASGEIFWVDGLRVGERFKVRPGTRRRLAWSRAEAVETA